MIKTLSPYNSAATTSKTAEILSRYRPIAPKPEVTSADGPSSPSASSSSSPTSSTSQKIRQSPYLRTLWPQLQARPTRTRKRGRAAISPPSLKRQRNNHHSATLGGMHPATAAASPASTGIQSINFQAFPGLGLTGHQLLPAPAVVNARMEALATSPRSLVTLPLLPCPSAAAAMAPVSSEDHVAVPELSSILQRGGEEGIDLKLSTGLAVEIPEEKDLLRQLQGQSNTSPVIAPQPLRPVGSSISVVGSISSETRPASKAHQLPKKKPEEVEEEVECEELPAVITDSNNRVRLANSAYKEMVGQPECPWLESMVVGSCGSGERKGSSPSSSSPRRRIGGEVALRFPRGEDVPAGSDGFSCWVRIEWGSEGKKSSVRAFCQVTRLACDLKDYLFTWRFHTQAR